MTAHYSKYSLNTYPGTSYFRAQLPKDYPLDRVLQKCRAFRRLPPNLRKLATLSKQYTIRNGQNISDIDEWYDAKGNELDPSTGRKLTDAEIDTEWDDLPFNLGLDGFAVADIPVPSGGFPDPATWKEPKVPAKLDEDRPTPAQLEKDIRERGWTAAAEEYGMTESELFQSLGDRGQALIGWTDPTGEAILGIATGEHYTGTPLEKQP